MPSRLRPAGAGLRRAMGYGGQVSDQRRGIAPRIQRRPCQRLMRLMRFCAKRFGVQRSAAGRIRCGELDAAFVPLQRLNTCTNHPPSLRAHRRAGSALCRSSQRRAVEKIRVSILLPKILQKILDKIGIRASFDAA